MQGLPTHPRFSSGVQKANTSLTNARLCWIERQAARQAARIADGVSILLCLTAVTAGRYVAACLNGGAQQVTETAQEEATL